MGGHAVALHGAVRGTLDVDIALTWSRKSLRDAERALQGLGLVSRLPINADEVYAFRDDFIEKRNLVAWNFYNPGDLSEQVDIVLTYDLKGKRIQKIALGETSLNILSLKDLVAMKLESGRPQDVSDAEALKKLK